MEDLPFITLAAGGMQPVSSSQSSLGSSSPEGRSLRNLSPASSISADSHEYHDGQPHIGRGIISPTHDISRTKYHIAELSVFAEHLEHAAAGAFPNKNRSRYDSVKVLLLRWEEDPMGVQYELEDLAKSFERSYGFETETWLIPTFKPHFALMQKALQIVDVHGKSDSLLIVYYAGHSMMNASRQAIWTCTSDVNYASLKWNAIQTLFEQADSDVLLLLDCCTAASGAPTDADSVNVTETIAACGFETSAPQPGRHSFTNTLIEVLEDWKRKPIFSASMLHCEILDRLRHEKPEKYRNTKRFEHRRTPIHVLNTSNIRAKSIEISSRLQSDKVKGSLPDLRRLRQESTSIRVPLSPNLNCTSDSIYAKESLTQVFPNGERTVPHVLISLALEEEQLLDVEQCRRWLQDFPALATYANVQGVYRSNSTLLILSIPVSIWNLIPDDPACAFIGYVHSQNMLVHAPFTYKATTDEKANQDTATLLKETVQHTPEKSKANFWFHRILYASLALHSLFALHTMIAPSTFSIQHRSIKNLRKQNYEFGPNDLHFPLPADDRNVAKSPKDGQTEGTFIERLDMDFATLFESTQGVCLSSPLSLNTYSSFMSMGLLNYLGSVSDLSVNVAITTKSKLWSTKEIIIRDFSSPGMHRVENAIENIDWRALVREWYLDSNNEELYEGPLSELVATVGSHLSLLQAEIRASKLTTFGIAPDKQHNLRPEGEARDQTFQSRWRGLPEYVASGVLIWIVVQMLSDIWRRYRFEHNLPQYRQSPNQYFSPAVEKSISGWLNSLTPFTNQGIKKGWTPDLRKAVSISLLVIVCLCVCSLGFVFTRLFFTGYSREPQSLSLFMEHRF